MTRIAHISDLHFGRADERLLTPLLTALNDARPDLVAVSGDLTQRARRSQFRAARDFLDRIEAPVLVVPGNHDIPLDLPWSRFFRPFRRYREAISQELAPIHRAPGLLAVGLNTVDRFRWQRGKLRWLQLRRACRLFSGSSGINLVVAHHPFEQEADVKKSLMPRASQAIEELSDCGAHLLLTGHLHRWRAAPFLSRKHGARVLQVHVGTGLSTRLRGEKNDFALLDLGPDAVRVTRMVAMEDGFRPYSVQRYSLGPQGWRALP